MCRRNGWSAMLRIIASKHDGLRMLAPKQRPPFEEVWHLWTVIIPRRSITGRLLWGTVLRRRDDGRWIYKKYTDVEATENREFARTLVNEARMTASPRRPYLGREHEVAGAASALGVLIMLVGDTGQNHRQNNSLPATCDWWPLYHSQYGRIDTGQSCEPVVKLRQTATPQHHSNAHDANGNPAGVVISRKTNARARVGIAMLHASKPISTTWKITTVRACCLWVEFGAAHVRLRASTHAERPWMCVSFDAAWLIHAASCPLA